MDEMERFIEEAQLDRSAYLRDVLRKGFMADKQERLLLKYTRGEASLMEVCDDLSWNPWEFFAQLKARNMTLNVSLEDWMDAGELDSSGSKAGD